MESIKNCYTLQMFLVQQQGADKGRLRCSMQELDDEMPCKDEKDATQVTFQTKSAII
jgi:hypothetical protein